MSTKKNVPAKISDKPTFDELYFRDEEVIKKEVKHKESKEGKRVQLFNDLNQIRLRITKLSNEYRASLVDPTKNSIDLKIDLLSAEKEMEIGKAIYNELFPEEKFV